MKRPRRPGSSLRSVAGFEVVEGEEGGEPLTGGGDTGTYDVGAYDPTEGSPGSIAGVSTLNLEIALLSIGAVDEIAADIARRLAPVAKREGIRSIILSNSGLLAAMRLRAALVAELDVLEAAAPEPGKIDTADVEAGLVLQEAGAVVETVVQSMKQASETAASALSSFAITTRFSGRKNTVGPRTLDAALAKHLASQGLEVRLPTYGLPKRSPSGFIGRLLRLQARYKSAVDSGGGQHVSEISQSLDALVLAIFGNSTGEQTRGQAATAQQLILADSLSLEMDKGAAALFAEIAVSGGSYRTRRWILNFLTGSDGLTYNGGAAVTYFLFRGDQQTALASDTLYFATPHDRFEKIRRRPRSTNLGGRTN